MKLYFVPGNSLIRVFDFTEAELPLLVDIATAIHNPILGCIEISTKYVDTLLGVFPSALRSQGLLDFLNERESLRVDLPERSYWQSLLPDYLQLRPFQIDTLEWFETRRLLAYPPRGTQVGTICELDQGLGKTIVGIVWDVHLRKRLDIINTLIICRNNNKYTSWADHLDRLTPLKYVVIEGDRSNRMKMLSQFRRKVPIAIIHYEAMRLHGPELRDDIDHVIIDEAQKVANADSQQSKVCNSITERIKHITELTGSVVQNKIATQLWHPLHLCDRKVWGSFARWKSDYCILDTISVPIYYKGRVVIDRRTKKPMLRNITVIAGVKNKTALAKAAAPYIYKRTKAEVAEHLPPKIFQTVEVGLTTKQRRLYKEVLAGTRTEINGKTVSIALTKTLRLLQVIATLEYFDLGDISGKADEMVDFILDALPENAKGIVFTQHVLLASAIYRRLVALGCKSLLLTGENPSSNEEKDIIRVKFKTENFSILCTTIQLEGEGSSYPEATWEFIADRLYPPKQMLQAHDRIHRFTSVLPVNIIDFVARGTIEEEHLKTLKEKGDEIDSVYDAAKLFTMADIQKWLSVTPKEW